MIPYSIKNGDAFYSSLYLFLPSEVCADAEVELAAGEVVGDGVAVVVDVGDPVIGAGVIDVE